MAETAPSVPVPAAVSSAAPPAPAEGPLAEVVTWLEAARSYGELEPTAMALATVAADGTPEVRMVLLKGCDATGLVFYTNLESPKAAALQAHPHAATCFWWPKQRRQLRVSGPVVPVTDAEADAYFASRPRLSQIGAWASDQSRPMRTPLDLEGRVASATLRFAVGRVPRPPHWSGFRIEARVIEFWEDRQFRLHLRRRFERAAAGGPWSEARLYP